MKQALGLKHEAQIGMAVIPPHRRANREEHEEWKWMRPMRTIRCSSSRRGSQRSVLRRSTLLLKDFNPSGDLFTLLFLRVTTFGEDQADAIEHARDAIEEAIAAHMADGREVPEPKGKSRVLVILPMQTSLKVELYRLLTRENVTRAELMRRLNWKRESLIGCFVCLSNSMLPSALGHQVEISVLCVNRLATIGPKAFGKLTLPMLAILQIHKISIRTDSSVKGTSGM